MGQGPLLIAFVGGVIGGLGSLAGAALGGFVLGALINALQATLADERSTSYTQLFAFLGGDRDPRPAARRAVSTRSRKLQAWRRHRSAVPGR